MNMTSIIDLRKFALNAALVLITCSLPAVAWADLDRAGLPYLWPKSWLNQWQIWKQPMQAIASFTDGDDGGPGMEHTAVITRSYVQMLDYDSTNRTHQVSTVYSSSAGLLYASGHRPSDGDRHVFVVEGNGDVAELCAHPWDGTYNRAGLGNVTGGVGVASYEAGDDVYQHVIVALGDGSLHEIYYHPWYGIFHDQL